MNILVMRREALVVMRPMIWGIWGTPLPATIYKHAKHVQYMYTCTFKPTGLVP